MTPAISRFLFPLYSDLRVVTNYGNSQAFLIKTMVYNDTVGRNHISSTTMVCPKEAVYFVGGKIRKCWEWRECLVIKGWLYPCAFPANEHTDPTGQGSRYSAAWEWVGKHPYLSTPNFSQKAPPVFGIRHLCYVLYYSLAASNVCPPSIPQKVISLFCRLLWLWSSM